MLNKLSDIQHDIQHIQHEKPRICKPLISLDILSSRISGRKTRQKAQKTAGYRPKIGSAGYNKPPIGFLNIQQRFASALLQYPATRNYRAVRGLI